MTQSRRFSYHFYYFIVLGFIIVGIINSLYLALTHYRNYTDIYYSSFCAISRSLNCDTVSQSSWSLLFNLPVALWGTMGYLFFLIILSSTYKNTPSRFPLWSILIVLGFLFSVVSLFFGYISSARIHSYCILCIFSYTINFLLFFSSWIIYRRFCTTSFLTSIVKAFTFIKTHHLTQFLILLLLTGSAIIYFSLPHYWQYTLPPLPKNILTGTTKEGHPWIGAEHPLLTIDEYTDYQCFQCYKMHYTLRRLIVENPNRIRLIHHHFPMDSKVNSVVVPKPFHEGSGDLAKIAILATYRDKFWQTNDLLYKIARGKEKEISLAAIADETGLNLNELSNALTNSTINELLRRDIWFGMKSGITGTPSFIVNGHVYQGSIPTDILQEILQ